MFATHHRGEVVVEPRCKGPYRSRILSNFRGSEPGANGWTYHRRQVRREPGSGVVFRPDENHTAATIGARIFGRRRRWTGVDLDAREIARRRQQVEVERRGQRNVVEHQGHWACAELRISAFTLTQGEILRE